eukprot:m.105273 g.105273  ORF g.105273 m.105273 type:complete len:370 (+) comp15790_c0_seq1:78-1187(+)
MPRLLLLSPGGLASRGLESDELLSLAEAHSHSAELMPFLPTPWLEEAAPHDPTRITAELNAAIRQFRASLGHGHNKQQGTASSRLAQIIMMSIHSRCADWSIIRNYTAGTAKVYGECPVASVSTLVHHLRLSKDDVFLDLGSGIGNVVLQVAAEARCRATGIEIRPDLHTLAKKMGSAFAAEMDWHGKARGEWRLVCGDFTAGRFERYFREATVIFANNLKFDAANQSIKDRLWLCKDGTRIVCSERLIGARHRLSARVAQDITPSLVSEHIIAPASWTAEIPYYIYTVRRKESLLPLQSDVKQRQHIVSTFRIRYARNRKGWVFVHKNGGLSKGYKSAEAAAEAALHELSSDHAVVSTQPLKRKCNLP